MSRPLRDDDLTLYRQGETFIGLFHNRFRGNANKNLHFSRINITFIHLRQNRGEKALSVDLSSKFIFLDVEITFRYAFCLQCLQCCDLRNLCARIRLLATHSLNIMASSGLD